MKTPNPKPCSEFPCNEQKWVFVKHGQIAIGGLTLATALFNARGYLETRGLSYEMICKFIHSVEKECKIHGSYTLRFAEGSLFDVDWHIHYGVSTKDFLYPPKEWTNNKP